MLRRTQKSGGLEEERVVELSAVTRFEMDPLPKWTKRGGQASAKLCIGSARSPTSSPKSMVAGLTIVDRVKSFLTTNTQRRGRQQIKLKTRGEVWASAGFEVRRNLGREGHATVYMGTSKCDPPGWREARWSYPAEAAEDERAL